MPQLDSLRAFAVLAVFYQHCFSHEYWLFHVPWGGVGVLCFFVISGFLITSILLKEFDGSASLRSVIVPFLIRRAARLMPLLAAVLAIAFVLDFPSMRATFWWHITYLSNIYFSFHGFHSGANHFWTLAAEEQFYIFWPLVLFFVPRRSLPIIVIALIASRLFSEWFWNSSGLVKYGSMLPPGSFDALAMGALLAICRDSQLFRRVLPLIGIIGGVLCIASSRMEFVGLFFVWIVAMASEGNSGPVNLVLNNNVLRYLGKISYGLYVLEPFVRYYLISWIDFPQVELFAVPSTLITISLASLSWHFFEQPIRRYVVRAIDRPKEVRIAPLAAVASRSY